MASSKPTRYLGIQPGRNSPIDSCTTSETLGVDFNWRIRIVPGAEHSNAQMTPASDIRHTGRSGQHTLTRLRL